MGWLHYLRDIWFGVAPKTNTQKKNSKEIGLHSQTCVLSIYAMKQALELQLFKRLVINCLII